MADRSMNVRVITALACCALWTPLDVTAGETVLPEAIAALLDAGADPMARSNLRLTPLHVAAGASEMQRHLVQKKSFIKRKAKTMFSRPPDANVLNPILWLGSGGSKQPSPVGSGVVAHVDDKEYLITALHVAKSCNFKPLLRSQGKWNSINWRTVATDRNYDIAVLETDTVLDAMKTQCGTASLPV